MQTLLRNQTGYQICFLCLLSFVFIAACSNDPRSSTSAPDPDQATAHQSDIREENPAGVDPLDRGIAAHGGLDRWRSYAALSFDIPREQGTVHHTIDLWSRKTLQTTPAYQLGFDGSDVWVAPGLDAYSGNARFANGLDFYFFAIPFVLADPGANREVLGQVTIDDKAYNAVKISYDAGVGDSPEDYYIVHFDPDTHRMSHLLYTATYFSGEPSENYNARVYSDWQDIDGLLLPGKITAYHWDSESRRLGEQRGETVFTNIELSTAPPESTLFQKPETAEIAPGL